MRSLVAIGVLLHASLSVCLDLPANDHRSAAVPADELHVRSGFRAERLLAVPRDYASWINMTFDSQGRLIVSDQGNRMHAIVPAKRGVPGSETVVSKLDIGVGGAHGLLHWKGSLFVVTGGAFPQTGVFRLDEYNGSFGSPKLLLKIPGGNEHGPHGIVPGPEGKWLYVVAGNATGLPDGITHDHIVTWTPTERAARPAPQGWVMRISPDGKRRELVCVGLRNAYDLAFNADGELFTFDSDNEGFHGLPWYRPTNVYHIVRGADFGWRQSPANLQPYYPDNPPPVREVGPGSPTGIVFGTRTAFPRKYRNALFACDWSYGRIYSVHLQNHGATYQAEQEFFVSGRPLPVTDISVGPDGDLYFVTGGRGTPSALYRVYWDGPPDDGPDVRPTDSPDRQLRRELESINGDDATIVEQVWPHLHSHDRSIRYAARSALERVPVARWLKRIASESHLNGQLEGLLAIARHGTVAECATLFEIANRMDWPKLNRLQRHSLLRSLAVAIERHGPPVDSDRLMQRIQKLFPAGDGSLNEELAALLSSLGESTELPADFAQRLVAVVEQTPTLMGQIHYLKLIGGGRVRLSSAQAERLKAAVDPFEFQAFVVRPYASQQREFSALMSKLDWKAPRETQPPLGETVREWSVTDLKPLLQDTQLEHGNASRGQILFRRARCANCHRLGNTGGVLGPALDGLAGRYTREVILESLVDPSRVIADQYRSTTFVLKSGKVVTGQIVNLSGDTYKVQYDPYRPFARMDIRATDIDELSPSDVSLMPNSLLNTMTREEIRDLLVYLLKGA